MLLRKDPAFVTTASAIRFTRQIVNRLACPSDKTETIYWDAPLQGFGLRIRGKQRRWIVQYRTAHGQRRETLGDPANVDLEAARTYAKSLLARVRLGADPQAEIRAARAAIRLGALVEDYLADRARDMRQRSLVETTRHLRIHAKPLHARPASALSRNEIASWLMTLERSSGAVAANRTRSSLSALYTWAIREGRQENNPVIGTRKREETPRERVLADAELALIWQATGTNSDYDRIVRLLMLTGARRDEIGRMRWSEIEGDSFVLPSTRSKNHLLHEVPLTALALAQLPLRERPGTEGDIAVFGLGADTGGTGYSGWSRSKARLDARLPSIPAWTLHDLRRTFATWLSEHGTEPHVVEALLNHRSGDSAKSSVAGIYNRASYRDAKRAALVRWSEHLLAITTAR
jgi:integrase